MEIPIVHLHKTRPIPYCTAVWKDMFFIYISYIVQKDQNCLKLSCEINGKKKGKNNRVCLWPAVDTSPHNDAMFWSDKHKGLSIRID